MRSTRETVSMERTSSLSVLGIVLIQVMRELIWLPLQSRIKRSLQTLIVRLADSRRKIPAVTPKKGLAPSRQRSPLDKFGFYFEEVMPPHFEKVLKDYSNRLATEKRKTLRRTSLLLTSLALSKPKTRRYIFGKNPTTS